MSTKISSIGIIGAGLMGTGIAEACALAGFPVILVKATPGDTAAIEKRVRGSLEGRVAKGKLDSAAAESALARLTFTADRRAIAACDLVIESIVEDLALKKDLFAHLDQVVQPLAILATNTSTLPVIELAMVTKRPEQVCGIHFFNPAPAMKLVEVVRPLTASDETIATAMAFATACDKDAVEVKDRAGFVVNALLFPYLNSAIRMAESGTASMESIDVAMKGGCNFPMGPFALLDLVGLDTSVAILDALYEEFRDPNYAAVPTLRRLVAAGRLGRKSGAGFYEYP
jgi:3-hydroxybutyryl-CoA dehydrogenase